MQYGAISLRGPSFGLIRRLRYNPPRAKRCPSLRRTAGVGRGHAARQFLTKLRAGNGERAGVSKRGNRHTAREPLIGVSDGRIARCRTGGTGSNFANFNRSADGRGRREFRATPPAVGLTTTSGCCKPSVKTSRSKSSFLPFGRVGPTTRPRL